MIAHAVRVGVRLAIAIGAAAVLQQPNLVPLTFVGVPRAATTLVLMDQRSDGLLVPRSRHPLAAPGTITIAGVPGSRTFAVFPRADNAYVADGPIEWPDRPSTRRVPSSWRRTVQARGGSADTGRLDWVSTDHDDDGWPRCGAVPGVWECWGIALDSSGVIVSGNGEDVQWSIVAPRVQAASIRRSKWGRLLEIGDVEPATPVDVRLRRLVAPPPHRWRDIRVQTTELKGRADPVAGNAVWISGDEDPPGAWVEIAAGGLGPVLAAVHDLASGLPALVHRVTFPEPATVAGTVLDESSAPVPGALVSLFRLVDPPGPAEDRPDGTPRARRVAAGEQLTGEGGGFSFAPLAAGDYEVLVWHGRLGRRSVLVSAPAEAVRVRLAPGRTARGRVLRRGRPAPGVTIVSVPDLAAVSTVDDLTELKGGDGTTGLDGRFVVALPDASGGELRIGGGRTAVKRIPFPAASAAASVDLGDIELPDGLAATFVLDEDPGCDLTIVGPLGHAGLQIVTAERTERGMFETVLPEAGSWRVVLSCAGTERLLVPAIVNVGAGTPPVRLRVQ